MTESKKQNSIIRHFSPAWFAASMGTGGLANVLYSLNANSLFLKSIGIILGGLNIVIFILLFFPWILRWFLHLDKLTDDLKHPVMSNFFVTMPAACLILGTNFFIMGSHYFSMQFISGLSLALWSIGAILTLLFGVIVTLNMMLSESVQPEVTNFAWFIAPVASIAVPLLGNPLVKYYIQVNPELAKFINLMDLSFFGIGFILFIILGSIVLQRFIYHKMPHKMVLPTFWVILGPIGVGTVTLMSLGDINVSLNLLNNATPIKFLALILYGFGLWAFFLVLFITAYYLKQGKVPFTLSFWAFIFPLSAYTLSSLQVYHYTGVKVIYDYTLVLTVLLSALFVFTFIKSIIGVFNKKLLIPINAPEKK